MQKKKGISLIVLVITIIVMVILATAIIITLDNAGIINKSKDAVEQSNLKQVQQLAYLAWADAYLDGKTTVEELKAAVESALTKNKIDTSKYNINVTLNGVNVSIKTADINEYGFYYDQLYVGTLAENTMGITKIGFVFHKDGSAEGYGDNGILSNGMFCMETFPQGTMEYSQKKIILDDGEGSNLTVSDDGLSMTGALEGVEISATCTFEELHGIYKGVTYTGTYQDSENGIQNVSFIISNDNVGTLTIGSAEPTVGNVTISADNHMVTFNSGVIFVSVDGNYLYITGENILLVKSKTVQDDNVAQTGHTGGLYDASGNLVASWDTLVNTYGLDVEKDYTSDTAAGQGTLKYIMANNEGLSSATHLKVSDKVTKIGDYALCNTTLTKVTLSSSVKTLGEYSIGILLNLESVEIPYGLETIGVAAFAGCSKLTSIVIPNSVKTIEDAAFGLSGITSLNIPASVTTLVPGIVDITDITTLTVDTANTVYKSMDDAIYTKDGKELIQVATGKAVDFVIPEGVTIIRESACSTADITGVSIPASVTTIEKYAFSESHVTNITFASNSQLETIGEMAFSSTQITSIDIPEGVSVIEERMFDYCSNLEYITLPSTITNIKAGLGGSTAGINLIIKATTPPTTVGGSFASITVPAGTAELYKAAEGWSEYASVIVEATE